jgi:hypothetical protein
MKNKTQQHAGSLITEVKLPALKAAMKKNPVAGIDITLE